MTDQRIPKRALTRLALALVVGVIAGTAFVLGLSAALDVRWDPRSTVVLAIAAVWLPQALISANRHRRR